MSPNNLCTSRVLILFSSPFFPLPPTKTNSKSTCKWTFAYGHSPFWSPGHTEHVEHSLGERERPISLICRSLKRKPKHSVSKDQLRKQSRQLSLLAFMRGWERDNFLQCQESVTGSYLFASQGNKCLTNSQHVQFCLPTIAGSTDCFSVCTQSSLNIYKHF